MLSEIQFYQYLDRHEIFAEAREYLVKIRNQQASRMVGVHATTNTSSWIYSEKMGCTISTESRTAERAFLIISEYTKSILEIWDQPEPVPVVKYTKKGYIRRSWYTSDFVLLKQSGPVVIEVKDSGSVADLLEAAPQNWVANPDGSIIYLPAKNYFESIGLKYEVWIASRDIRFRVFNQEMALKSRSVSKINLDKSQVDAAFNESFFWSLYDLKNRLGLDQYTGLVQAIDDKNLFFNWDSSLFSAPKGCNVVRQENLLEYVDEFLGPKIYEDGFLSPISVGELPPSSYAEEALSRLEKIKNDEKSRSVRRWKSLVKGGVREGLSEFQSLIPKWFFAGNRKRRINSVVETFLINYLLGNHAESQGLSNYRSYIQYRVDAQIAHPMYPPVTKTTFTRRLRTIPPEVIARKRGGKRSANAVASPSDPLERQLKAELAWLNEYFVNNLDEGEGDFFEKLEAQIEPTSIQVKQLAAEMLWLMLLCPSNIKPDTKRGAINRIWQWSSESLDPPSELWRDDVLDGIGSGGTSFNTNRWRELVYFIKLTQAVLKLSGAERRELLAKPWEFAQWLEKVPENDSRQLRNMILFLLFPDTFERIFGGSDRKSIVSAFTGEKIRQVSKLSALEIDRKLHEIRKAQEKQFETDQLDFYVPPLKEQWKDVENKQWLLAWKPDDFQWGEIGEAITKTHNGESYIQRWPCSNFGLTTGDKVWILRQGKNPAGIFAVGNVVSEPYEDDHLREGKSGANIKANYVDVELTLVLDVFKNTFITQADLENIKIDNQNWQPELASTEIKKRSAGLLERLWNQIIPKRKEPLGGARQSLKDPVNLIYYGPPGTGKTYELNTLLNKYVSPASSVSREQWLAQELQPLRWFDVISMALHDLGGSAKAAQIEEHKFVQQKAKSAGRTRHIRAQIWATLQTHTVESSQTVNYSKRQAPYVFDKDENSVWSLTSDWRDSCKDQLQMHEALTTGPEDNKVQKRYEFVTFHQAYSYEEFVEGLRPIIDEDSGEVVYKVVPGVFRRLCQLAQNDPDNRYAIFVDEINRGNIAKILGELITLIEIDKRGEFANEDGASRLVSGMALTLPYSGESFSVPKNVDIYGTMNTADRSIALLDTALRRRFVFKELMPNSSIISGSGGDGYIPDGEGGVVNLRALLDAMNKRIQFFLGRDVMLGHAYLSKVKDFDTLKSVLLNQFIPLLQEHFYDDWERIQMIFGDIGPGGRALEPQIILHRTLSAADVFGFEPDSYESIKDYRIAASKEVTPDAIRKIYEGAQIGE